MTYFINPTADEYFMMVFLYILVAFVAIGIVTFICERVAKRIDEKKERERRAYKRSGAPIRPTRRY